jgi:hypothetical protein
MRRFSESPLARIAFIVAVLFWAAILDIDEAVCRTRDAIRDWRYRRVVHGFQKKKDHMPNPATRTFLHRKAR